MGTHVVYEAIVSADAIVGVVCRRKTRLGVVRISNPHRRDTTSERVPTIVGRAGHLHDIGEKFVAMMRVHVCHQLSIGFLRRTLNDLEHEKKMRRCVLELRDVSKDEAHLLCGQIGQREQFVRRAHDLRLRLVEIQLQCVVIDFVCQCEGASVRGCGRAETMCNWP